MIVWDIVQICLDSHSIIIREWVADFCVLASIDALFNMNIFIGQSFMKICNYT